MKTVRNALGALSLLYLGFGYAASQMAWFNGRTAEYTKLIDRPQIQLFSLLLVLVAVVFAFLRDGSETE